MGIAPAPRPSEAPSLRYVRAAGPSQRLSDAGPAWLRQSAAALSALPQPI